jgi:hypothetical protein
MKTLLEVSKIFCNISEMWEQMQNKWLRHNEFYVPVGTCSKSLAKVCWLSQWGEEENHLKSLCLAFYRTCRMKPCSELSDPYDNFSGGTEKYSIEDPRCLSRIRIFPVPDPGSRVKKIPGSASASKNLSILTQKIVFKLSEI